MVAFSTNPILFKIKYINGDRIDSTTNISAVVGQAFHSAVNAYRDPVHKTEADAIESGLKIGAEFLEQYEEGFIEYSTTIANKQKALETLTFLYNSYVQETNYTQTDEILATEECIEEYIDIDWRGQKLSLPVPLKGYPDIVLRQDGKLKIKDYKTCRAFSDPEKIDGAKIIQAIQYYFLVYSKFGEEPYSMVYEEVKATKNRDGGPQVKRYEVIYSKNELYFDFYFRFYHDMTSALNGNMVYVPNLFSFFDNEIAIVSYINRLDVEEDQAKLLKKYDVDNLTDLLKKQIQRSNSMRKLLQDVEKKFISAKNLNYNKMTNEQKIQTKLLEHGIMIQFDSMIEGSSVNLYRYTPSIGVKMSKIKSYVDDIEQVLGVSGIRVLAPIPNSSFVGFEVPRKDRVFPEDIPENAGFEVAIGQDIMGDAHVFDIRQAPHLLVAGASGSGKSVFLHSLIHQLKKTGSEIYIFDPKMVELVNFKDDVAAYYDDHTDIAINLAYLVDEMNARYKEMAAAKARNISEMPGMKYKFIIIDEFGDLTAGNGKEAQEVRRNILLLAQKARAAGIHLVIATQRPSTDVITGTIKANFPAKVMFKTSKAVDSVVVIDEAGGEKLLGKGDMIFSSENGTVRLQGYKK